MNYNYYVIDSLINLLFTIFVKKIMLPPLFKPLGIKLSYIVIVFYPRDKMLPPPSINYLLILSFHLHINLLYHDSSYLITHPPLFYNTHYHLSLSSLPLSPHLPLNTLPHPLYSFLVAKTNF